MYSFIYRQNFITKLSILKAEVEERTSLSNCGPFVIRDNVHGVTRTMQDQRMRPLDCFANILCSAVRDPLTK